MKFSLWPCWLPDSPALEKHPAQSCVTAADWVSWSQDLCFLFDRRVWNSWVKSSLRWYLRRLLWWWFMTGIAFKWMKEFCWMSFLRRTSENCIKDIKIWTINIIQIFFYLFDWIHWLIQVESSLFLCKCFQTALNKIYIYITVSINVRTLEMHFPFSEIMIVLLLRDPWKRKHIAVTLCTMSVYLLPLISASNT